MNLRYKKIFDDALLCTVCPIMRVFILGERVRCVAESSGY